MKFIQSEDLFHFAILMQKICLLNVKGRVGTAKIIFEDFFIEFIHRIY